MSTPSGGLTFSSSLSVAVAASGNVLSGYNVPVQPTALVTTYAAGTAAGLINRIASLAGSAAATPATIDLTTVVCVDGAVGFTHVREIIVYNDSTTAPLLLDCTVANSLIAFCSAGGATLKLIIEPGIPYRIAKPLGTTGYTCTSTKYLTLDPAAATVAYRVILCGD